MIPLYFIDKESICLINKTLEVHLNITNEYTRVIDKDVLKEINRLLIKRISLPTEMFTDVISAITMNLISSQKYQIPYDCDTTPLKLALIKLIATHQYILDEEYINKNYTLLKYVKEIFNSINQIQLEHKKEISIYQLVVLI